MPQSLITTHIPTFTSQKVIDKVVTVKELFLSLLPSLTIKMSDQTTKPVLALDWEYLGPPSSGAAVASWSWPYSPSNSILKFSGSLYKGFIGNIKSVNDFSLFDVGIVYNSWCSGATISNFCAFMGILEGDAPTTNTELANLNAYCAGNAHALIGSNYNNTGLSTMTDNMKFFTYSGDNIAYIAFYYLNRCMVFTYAHSMDNPAVKMPVIIASVSSAISENFQNGVSEANVVQVAMYNSRVVDMFTTDIYGQTHNTEKLILYKFAHKGYYFDNVFTYSGTIPSTQFIYDGDEYIKIGLNVLIKLS